MTPWAFYRCRGVWIAFKASLFADFNLEVSVLRVVARL